MSFERKHPEKKGVRIRIPGKVMLAGEYTVLEGGSCLSSTLDCAMTVLVSPLLDLHDAWRIQLTSDFWEDSRPPQIFSENSEFEEKKTTDPTAQAIYLALKLWSKELKSLGSTAIHLDTGLNVRHGFGSSSALRLGILAGLYGYIHQKILDDTDLYKIACLSYELQKSEQVRASGYDFVTQLHGGLLRLRQPESYLKNEVGLSKPQVWSLQKLLMPPEELGKRLFIYVSDIGAPTNVTMSSVQRWFQDQPQRWQDYSDSMNVVVGTFNYLLQKSEWPKSHSPWESLISAVAAHRSTWEQSPAFPKNLFKSLRMNEGFDRTFTVKTTGAGGQDALLLLGSDSVVKTLEPIFAEHGFYLSPNQFCSRKIEVCFEPD